MLQRLAHRLPRIRIPHPRRVVPRCRHHPRHALRGVVLTIEPFQRQRQQRQRIGALRVVHQLVGQLGREREPMHGLAVTLRRSVDHRLELGLRHRGQAEQHRRHRLERRVFLQQRQRVGADRQHEEHRVGTGPCPRRVHHREERVGLARIVGGEEFLGLVDRDDQRRPRAACGLVAAGTTPHAFRDARQPHRLQQLPDFGGARQRAVLLEGVPNARRQSQRPGEHRIARSHGLQHDEMGVPPQARQQARAQERRLPRSRRAEDHEQTIDALLANQPQLVDRANDLRVAAEEDRGVRFVERAQSRVRRAPPVVRRRPLERRRVEPCATQPAREAVEPVARKADDRADRHARRHRDPEGLAVVRMRQVAQLPLRRHLRVDRLDRDRFDHHAEDALAELLRGEELREAVLRRVPRRRHQEQHRLAAVDRVEQRRDPALAGRDAARRVEVQEVVVPAFARQPLRERQRRGVVDARVTNEDAGHRASLGRCEVNDRCAARSQLLPLQHHLGHRRYGEDRQRDRHRRASKVQNASQASACASCSTWAIKCSRVSAVGMASIRCRSEACSASASLAIPTNERHSTALARGSTGWRQRQGSVSCVAPKSSVSEGSPRGSRAGRRWRSRPRPREDRDHVDALRVETTAQSLSSGGRLGAVVTRPIARRRLHAFSSSSPPRSHRARCRSTPSGSSRSMSIAVSRAASTRS